MKCYFSKTDDQTTFKAMPMINSTIFAHRKSLSAPNMDREHYLLICVVRYQSVWVYRLP